jgi:hypothetical protein
MTVFPIVNQSLPAIHALQDEQMVRHRALFGTSKGVRRIGNLSLHSREKIPIRCQVGGRGEPNPAAKKLKNVGKNPDMRLTTSIDQSPPCGLCRL